ncbi:glycerophosphodiester phosphodiesterase [Roseimaritima sediminicola]|uniref:glycerophosphodiester phosphodiesterase n=1 Tax=Roseimaritima sediminicola TaxID=2662066 RepID=UPI001F1CD10E|nr:glycerophosphodiester phosphodiesterase [Roseimaritima sediminicola]
MRHLLTFLTILVFPMVSTALGQQIVAHRGASHDAPENTLAAFRQAWQQNADAIEGDFYLTADQHIVCLHDKNTKRVAPQAPVLTPAKATLEELRKLDVGSWKHPRYKGEQIPTLAEVLETIPAGKQIFLEIKCGPEILPVLKPQLESSGLDPEQVVIICFNEAVIRGARETMPQYKANYLTGYKRNKTTGRWSPSRQQVIETLKQTQATGLGSQGKRAVLDEAFARAVREAGKELHVWTVNDADDAKAFADLGVDSITTDRPGYIRNVLAGRSDAAPAGAVLAP